VREIDAFLKARQDYDNGLNGGTPTSAHGELGRQNRHYFAGPPQDTKSTRFARSDPARPTRPDQVPGTRVDPETGVIQRKSFFGGWKDSNTRIDRVTGSIQRNSLFGWRGTGERIDPATGKHQRRGWFGWNDA
jgi:hypothetical protein